jgi:hypothetical protein
MDRLQQLHVADGSAEREAQPGQCSAETALGHEDALLLGVAEVEGAGVGAQLPARGQLDDLRVDRLDTESARDGDAMVPVDDEVGLAQLLDGYRREATVREGPLDQASALPHVGSPGAELSVEVTATTVRAHDGIDRNRTDAEVAPGEGTQALGRFFEVEEIAGHTISTAGGATSFPCAVDTVSRRGSSGRGGEDARGRRGCRLRRSFGP